MKCHNAENKEGNRRDCDKRWSADEKEQTGCDDAAMTRHAVRDDYIHAYP